MRWGISLLHKELSTHKTEETKHQLKLAHHTAANEHCKIRSWDPKLCDAGWSYTHFTLLWTGIWYSWIITDYEHCVLTNISFSYLKKCFFQLSSLRFATRMKWITTEPVVNVTYDSEVCRERQWKELYFLISLIFRIITLRTWERFGSLMKFHSSASLRLTTFRYIRKKMDYFKLLPLLKLMLELLQSSVMVRVEHCIFLCFQDSISVSWTWEPLQHQSRKAAS